jgi:signal transduction histidine kinase
MHTISNDSVFIVDDDKILLRIFKKILGQLNCRIITENNSLKAEKLIEQYQPDLLILDVMMPKLDGFALLKKLKKNPLTKHIPALFVSAQTNGNDIVEGLKLGAMDYITKPVAAEEIIAKVKTQLQMARYRKALTEKNNELNTLNTSLEKLVEEKTRALMAKEKQSLIGSMVTGMVHNFRSPLTIISGYSEFLKDMVDGEAKEFVDKIIQATGQLDEMMQNLMIKTTLDQTTKTEKVDINTLIKREFDFYNANLRFKHEVEKKLELDETLPPVNMIYADLVQVFENLLNNALDAMWNQPVQQIRVKTSYDSENVYITISDTGIGIEADQIPRLFDPFYTSKPRKDQINSNEPSGTGLGLHSCQNTLNQYNGKIVVESVPGKGSTFSVVLPYK